MLLLSVLGIIIFLIATSLFPFKNRLFALLYAKPLSQAAEPQNTPTVTLKIEGINSKVISTQTENTPLTISWKSSNVTSCVGRSWGITDKDQSWRAPKNPNGSFKTAKLTKNNAYIYTIDCVNQFGDAAGDSVTINIGSPSAFQKPYITSFEVYNLKGEKLDTTKPVSISLGEKVKISWTTLNLSTPYSSCIAQGSWPTQYQNADKVEVVEQFLIDQPKIYRYSLYCSNELDLANKNLTIIPK